MAFNDDITAPPYNCPTNGTSDCWAAFDAFRIARAGQTGTLLVPAGTYNFGPNPAPSAYIFGGVPNLTVNMTGATFQALAGGGSFEFGGGDAIDFTISVQPRIQSVQAGATSITLSIPADASKFIGSWMLVTGGCLQSVWQHGFGAPLNNQFLDFVQITGISGTTISFTPALQYSYLSTWPWWSQGMDGPDEGGPAIAIPLLANWDCVHVYNGGTLISGTSAINSAGRMITYNGSTLTGPRGINPSEIYELHLNNCIVNAATEVDKVLGKIYLEGSTTTNGGAFEYQSASTAFSTYLSGTANVNFNHTGRSLIGTGTGWTIGALTPGPSDNGRCDEINLSTGTITAWGNFGGGVDSDVTSKYTMVNGVIVCPNTLGAGPGGPFWAVPGTRCIFSGANACAVPFNVLAVTQDATNVYIQTTRSGGWPSIPLSSGKLNIQIHPCPRGTFDPGIVSSDLIVRDLCQSTPGRPIYEYTKRTYSKADTVGAITSPNVFGKINFIRFNVITPYAGVQSTLTLGYTFAIYGLDDSNASFSGVINLRTAGVRTFAPSGTTGIQSGDTNQTLPYGNAYNWMANGFGLNPNMNVSGEATSLNFSVEVSTNQDFFTPVAPLRLGLHA